MVEEVIGVSTANIPNVRYCDYNKMDIDPSNDNEFWFINEIRNGPRRGIVGAFQLTPPQPNDIGMVTIDEPNSGTNLTSTENVVVTGKQGLTPTHPVRHQALPASTPLLYPSSRRT